jgi:hypothetical protein
MEVDQYLSDPNKGSSKLEFWQVVSHFFLSWWCFFYTNIMDIIPIQASSVLCERVFLSGKQIMTPCKGHISAKLMESLQIMKFSIQKGRALNFTEGMRWRDELREFELAACMPPR